jgi:hypothetical protein
MTQESLGLVLHAQGKRIGGNDGMDLLDKAVTAYRQALRIFKKEEFQYEWATTQAHLANALRDQAIRIGGKGGQRTLLEALEAYYFALQVMTKDAAPAEWEHTVAELKMAQKALAHMR